LTAQPRPEKIRDIAALIHPPISQAEKGDVRLEFRDRSWKVTKHAIDIQSMLSTGTMQAGRSKSVKRIRSRQARSCTVSFLERNGTEISLAGFVSY